jgi:hypothetical protein
MIVSGIGTGSITWGDPGILYTGPGRMLFTGRHLAAAAGSEFILGTLDYFNGSVLSGTSPRDINLKVSLNFASPAGAGVVLDFRLELINTPNEGTPEEQADVVLLQCVSPGKIFTLGGVPYSARVRFGNSSDGGFTEIDRFFVYEGQNAGAELTAVITAIPEPATWILLFGGLPLLAVAARLRRSPDSPPRF